MTNLIGISGKIGSGKDEVFKIIQELTNNSFENRKFADQLKDTVCMWIGCSREQLENREFKETPLSEEWDHFVVTSSYGAPDEIYFEDPGMVHSSKRQMTPRLMLQLLGTEAGRKIIHPNIWVNALFADYKVYHEPSMYPSFKEPKIPKWVITDCRFPNEAEAIKNRGGIVIRLERDHCCGDVGFCDFGDGFNCSKPISNHASETGLDDYQSFDHYLDNNYTLDDLKENVKNILLLEGCIQKQ